MRVGGRDSYMDTIQHTQPSWIGGMDDENEISSFGKSLFGLGGELRTHTNCLSSSAIGPLGEEISLDSLSVSLLESITSCRSQQSIADCCDSQVEPFKMLERFMASRVKKNGRESILAVSVTVTVRL